jgi:hypothetical protein
MSETVTEINYVERWEQALRVLENMTEHERLHHFDMSFWAKKTDCGTVACLAGHCSFDPWFRERDFIGEIDDTVGSEINFKGQLPTEFFGRRGYYTVFMEGGRDYDDVVDAVHEQIEYLKGGGNPNYVERSDEDWGDDDDYEDDDYEEDGDDNDDYY